VSGALWGGVLSVPELGIALIYKSGMDDIPEALET
jgi:hypothetical protein